MGEKQMGEKPIGENAGEGRTRAPPQSPPHFRGGAAAPPHPPLMSAVGLPNYWFLNRDLIKKLINREAGGRH